MPLPPVKARARSALARESTQMVPFALPVYLPFPSSSRSVQMTSSKTQVSGDVLEHGPDLARSVKSPRTWPFFLWYRTISSSAAR